MQDSLVTIKTVTINVEILGAKLNSLGLTADRIAAIFLNSTKNEVVVAHVEGSFDITTKQQLVIPRMDLPALMTWSNIETKGAIFFEVDTTGKVDYSRWIDVADQLVGLKDKNGNRVNEIFCAGYGLRTAKQFVKIGTRVVDMTPDNGVEGIGSVRFDKVNRGLVAVGLDQKFRGVKILAAGLDVLDDISSVIDSSKWRVVTTTIDPIISLSRIQSKGDEMRFYLNLLDGYHTLVTVKAGDMKPVINWGDKFHTPVTVIGHVNAWDNVFAGYFDTPDYIGVVLQAVSPTEQPFVALTLDL